MNEEQTRLRDRQGDWKRWGPYLAERQWGTVREDYSPDGSAWSYLPHDHARSRAYRWGEDGIAGISDETQRLCFAIGLWNGRDPILKERLFGLTGEEGNHGEDVKELYYYLDSTPTHSYMKALYKYPQAEFPYEQLVAVNAERTRSEPEFELMDTGIFEENRYFDVEVEYAKASSDDLLIVVTAHNRGPETSLLHLLPQLWFRNTWSWKSDGAKPIIRREAADVAALEHADFGSYRFYCEGSPELLFCDNETNTKRLFGQKREGYFKDGFHEYLIAGRAEAVNSDGVGTKLGAHFRRSLAAGESVTLRMRLSHETREQPFGDFEEVFALRKQEADSYYAELQRSLTGADERAVQRQALAGLLWSKQFYYYDVPEWLEGDPGQAPPPPERKKGRNHEWLHLNNADIISMPDTWEYPWYAAWDLAFQCIPLAMVDVEFAKQQLVLLTREWYMHPNGQLPAYEWALGDVNPPVHAWSAWRVYKMDKKAEGGRGDLDFLERVFHKLLLNFTWWVNRKDEHGNNLFQGGFLGLDNIGVFDRSAPLPGGGHLEQADGTSWMAMYSLNLMRMALELTERSSVYQDLATKFFEHFLYIAAAMTNLDGEEIDLWDEEDEFFYDVLHRAKSNDGRESPAILLKVRSMVGLIPLFAVETLEPELLRRVPEFAARMNWFLKNRPELAHLVSHWNEPGIGNRSLLSLLRGHRFKKILARMLDETEFLSECGVRSLSKYHEKQPFHLDLQGLTHTVRYLPAESDAALFGGNSNWRGPVWFPVNFLIIESLQKFHHYYGDDFKVECPTGSGCMLTIHEVAAELTRRLTKIFLRDDSGARPVFGDNQKLQTDPHFKDHILFYEYFHGDEGRGLGASHQTGWTALVAKLLQPHPY